MKAILTLWPQLLVVLLACPLISSCSNRDREVQERSDRRRQVGEELIRYLPPDFVSFALAHSTEKIPDHPANIFFETPMRDPEVKSAFDAAKPLATAFAIRRFEPSGPLTGDYVGTQVIRCREPLDGLIAALKSDPQVTQGQIEGRESLTFDVELHEARQFPDGRYPVSRHSFIRVDDRSFVIITRPELAIYLSKEQGMTIADLNQASEASGGQVDFTKPFTMVRCRPRDSTSEAVANHAVDAPTGLFFESLHDSDLSFRMRLMTNQPQRDLKESLGDRDFNHVARISDATAEENSVYITGQFRDTEDGLHNFLLLIMFGFTLTL